MILDKYGEKGDQMKQGLALEREEGTFLSLRREKNKRKKVDNEEKSEMEEDRGRLGNSYQSSQLE